MLMRLVALLAPFAFGLIGCRGPSSAGGLDHSFGQARRAPGIALKDCQDAPEMKGQAADLREFAAYVRAVASEIAKANPATFSGDYDISKFCFVVTKGGTNAHAQPENRLVVLNTGMFGHFDTDATAASVIAHELAHVTMQHGYVPSQILTENANWRQLSEELSGLVSRKGALEKKNESLRERATTLQNDLAARASAEQNAARENLEREYNALSERILRLADGLGENDDSSDLYAAQDALLMPLPRTASAPPIPVSLRNISAPNIAGAWRETSDAIRAFNAKVKAQNEREAAANGKPWPEFLEVDAAIGASDLEWRGLDEKAIAVNRKLAALESQVLGTSQTSVNEEEADDVGLELYLRTGFEPAYFSALFEREGMGSNSAAEIAQCRSALASQGYVPERGMASHPSACWRLYNATIQEMNAHKDAYREMMKNATKRNIFPGRVDALRGKLGR